MDLLCFDLPDSTVHLQVSKWVWGTLEALWPDCICRLGALIACLSAVICVLTSFSLCADS